MVQFLSKEVDIGYAIKNLKKSCFLMPFSSSSGLRIQNTKNGWIIRITGQNVVEIPNVGFPRIQAGKLQELKFNY